MEIVWELYVNISIAIYMGFVGTTGGISWIPTIAMDTLVILLMNHGLFHHVEYS